MSSAAREVTQAADESPLAGKIALGLVIVATVVFTGYMWRMGQLAVLSLNGEGFDQEGYNERVGGELGEWATALFVAPIVSWIAGVAVGIYAVVTRSGRVYGLWTVVLGALSPFLGYAALLAGALSPIG